MNLKAFLVLGGVGFVLQGCTSMNALTSPSINSKKFNSPQEVIEQNNINENNSSAKEYVFDWGIKNKDKQVQSLIPRSTLSNYCLSKGGKFTLFQKSSMHLVREQSAKKLLNSFSSVKQGIGAYQCTQSNGQQWFVSIEPLSERKLDQNTRVVNLQTKILSKVETVKLYSRNKDEKSTDVKSLDAKNTDIKSNAQLIAEKKNALNKANAAALAKANLAKAEEKKAQLAAEELEKENQPVEKAASTPQSQQMQLYTAARKDLGRGQNQINACNNAERAYNYGRLRSNSGLNVYAESGVLVAKCLTSVSSYSRRFSDPQVRAKRILQNLATNQNHAVAKYMLKQMK